MLLGWFTSQNEGRKGKHQDLHHSASAKYSISNHLSKQPSLTTFGVLNCICLLIWLFWVTLSVSECKKPWIYTTGFIALAPEIYSKKFCRIHWMFIWRSHKSRRRTHFQQYKVLSSGELLKCKGKVADNNVLEIINRNWPTGLESSLLIA